MKILKVLRNKSKLLLGSIAATLTLLSTGVVAMASTGSTTVSYSDFSSFFDTLKAQISVTTILGVIGGVAAVCIGLVFFWWGVRKVTRMLMSAFKRGKITP